MIDDLRKLSQTFLKLKNSPYRRYIFREKLFEHRLSLLLGQSGVGKTTTLVQYLLDTVDQDIYSNSILYVQADHFLVGSSSLYEIAQQFHDLGGRTLAFDEIHKYQNWSQELKSMYDTFPKLNVIASGSSALQLHKGSHDLARRAIKYSMVGLSFREFLELSLGVSLDTYTLNDILANHEKQADNIISILEEKELKILPLFKKYICCGYYPYFLELPSKELYLLTLEQNLRSTIEVDLAAIYPHLSTSSINKLKELLLFIAKSFPFSPNWTQIKELLNIGDARTLKTYFAYLEDASLIRSLSTYTKKLDDLRRPEKIYLDNPNLMQVLMFEHNNKETEREAFLLNMLAVDHEVTLASKGDFNVDNTVVFEIGGRNKSFNQIAQEKNAFLALDDIEKDIGAKIPLWLFGFLY